jgi:hypothetical protein
MTPDGAGRSALNAAVSALQSTALMGASALADAQYPTVGTPWHVAPFSHRTMPHQPPARARQVMLTAS